MKKEKSVVYCVKIKCALNGEFYNPIKLNLNLCVLLRL